MSREAFELEWYGGMPAARLRRRRGDVDALAWGSLGSTRDHRIGAPLREAARQSFTEGAWNEYRTAAAFAELSRALLRARAPIDLVALAADFVVDEMVHVELNARMAMELGGGAPLFVDFEELVGDVESASPFERAVEIAVRVSCVGEALSGPLLACSARAASHPLTRLVLRRLAAEEGAHGAIGWMILDWAAERITPEQRLRLARVAEAETAALFAMWTPLSDCPAIPEDEATERALVGFAAPEVFLAQARRALRERVQAPLASRGIVVDSPLLPTPPP